MDMKKIYVPLIITALLAGSAVFGNTPSTFKAEEPILITSAGQSADILMVKVLAKKANLNFIFDKTAAPEKVDEAKSIFLVCGGSTKGLGAAKIDKEQEFERVKALIERAQKKNVTLIVMHVGGKSRRGKLSDYFNQLAADNADHMIVVKAGDQDGFFSEIAKKRKVGIDLPEKIINITELLQAIYGK